LVKHARTKAYLAQKGVTLNAGYEPKSLCMIRSGRNGKGKVFVGATKKKSFLV